MRALVKAQPGPGLVFRDEPMPVPGARDVLVKIQKTSLCGTDLHIYQWDDWAQKTIPTPLIIGHEWGGRY